MEQHCRTEFNQVNRVSFLIHHRYSYFLSLKKNVYLYTYIETSKADRERERERERERKEKKKKKCFCLRRQIHKNVSFEANGAHCRVKYNAQLSWTAEIGNGAPLQCWKVRWAFLSLPTEMNPNQKWTEWKPDRPGSLFTFLAFSEWIRWPVTRASAIH